MRINNIQQNYLQSQANLRRQDYNPQFTSAEKLSTQITELLPGKKALAAMKKLEWLKGEIGGILITALGTGLVAPIFIGTNPFVKAPKGASKEEKQDVINTKWYTAMRQPISAALAIMFQVSALKPIDKYLDKKFNIEENSQFVNLHMDQSRLNNKSFIKTLVNKEFKDANKKKPSLFRIFSDGYKNTMEARKAYTKAYDERVSEIGKEQLDKLAKEFFNTGEITIGSRKLDNKTIAKLINRNIDDYITDAKNLQIDDKGLSYYSERANILINNEEYLRKLFKNVPESDAEVEAFVKNLQSKETNNDVKKLLDEILERPSDIRRSRIMRTLSRIDSIKTLCENPHKYDKYLEKMERRNSIFDRAVLKLIKKKIGNPYSFDKYLEAMSRRNAELDKVITRLSLCKIQNPDSATKSTVTQTIDHIAEICNFKNKKLLASIVHDTTTFALEKDELLPKIYKDVTKSYKKFIEKKYKGVNQISKIAIGVCITLPITCTALNWVYPRLMELLFPKLAGVKKEGGNK